MCSSCNNVTFLYVLNAFVVLITNINGSEISDNLGHRSKRQLLFPNSTLLQFNAGVSVPSPAAMINVNWAFQANFQLPWNRSQIPIDLLEANSGYTELAKRDLLGSAEQDGRYENNAKLYHFYKYVEDVLNRVGHNGTDCVLRTLCQIAAEPLHTDDEEDLLHELASFVLNPQNDIYQEAEEQKEAEQYLEAFTNGEQKKNCLVIYEHCKISLVDMFSKLHDIKT